MNICVAGPVHGQAGNSTVAALLALLLSGAHKKKVCLTHISPRSDSLSGYLGVESWEDKDCPPSQLAKLIRTASITPRDLIDYCRRVGKNLDVFGVGAGAEMEDMETIQHYVLSRMPHDFLIADIDVNLESKLAKHALGQADLLVCTITQSRGVLERFERVMRRHTPPGALFVCNHYNPEVGSVGALAKVLKTHSRQICIIGHSENILKLSNEGRLGELTSVIKSTPLPGLEAHLKILSQTVLARYNLNHLQKNKRTKS